MGACLGGCVGVPQLKRDLAKAEQEKDELCRMLQTDVDHWEASFKRILKMYSENVGFQIWAECHELELNKWVRKNDSGSARESSIPFVLCQQRFRKFVETELKDLPFYDKSKQTWVKLSAREDYDTLKRGVFGQVGDIDMNYMASKEEFSACVLRSLVSLFDVQIDKEKNVMNVTPDPSAEVRDVNLIVEIK